MAKPPRSGVHLSVERGRLCDPSEVAGLMKTGDMAALDRMTRCYGDRLLAVGRRYCRTETEAEDAVQDALLSAGQHLRDFRGSGSVEGWLVRMVANACHHMHRGRKNDPKLHDVTAVLESGSASPEDAALSGQLSQALGEALLTLKPQDRAVVLLAEAEGWTGPEIAEKLDISAGAVRTRLSRARARLRDHLAESIDVDDLL